MCDREDAGIEKYLHPSELIGLDWIGLLFLILITEIVTNY